MVQRNKITVLLLFLCVAFLTLPGRAQSPSKVQSPSEFLGYELGTQWTPHYKVMEYFRQVAENTTMVNFEKYGETNEGRELMLAFISTEQNMGRLEEIRTDNLRRAGMLEGTPSDNKTIIVWLSYNVHGNETSSSEAAMKTIYELVRPDNAETKTWLKNALVVIDPMINPDGRDRYVHWYKETVGDTPNIDVESREHHEPWPGGRYNHYYFDLNRDWAWLTQKESRQRIAVYQKWLPQVHVDYHEMGYEEPYYFAPAAKPFHKAITDWQRDFQYDIGKNNAKYFDKNNWLFFTREVYDLFYPSYGDTYPIFNGAVGMTYEQAGGGIAGLGILKAEGDTLTLNDRMMHHYTTGLSTIEVSAQHAGQLVDEFSKYYETARNNPQGKYKTFVIKKENDPDKLQALFSLLDKHQVEYGKATRSRTLDGYNYKTGETGRVRVNEDDYLVSVYQPKSVMARVLFEPRPELADSVTYDITAWEQHYAYGLDGYALTQRLDVDPAEAPQKNVNNNAGGHHYVYVAGWKDLQDVGLLADLLKHDINVRYASEEFKIDDKEYNRGTLVITRSDNKTVENFDQLVQQVATHHNQQVDPVDTGFMQSGTDFGSSSVRYIKKPRVALLSGSETSATMVGEIWHYFDRQINYPITMIDTDYFNRIDLHDYDVLILPGGYYRDKLDDGRLKEIRDWISNGGKLIALEGANRILVGKEGFDLKWKKSDKNDNDSTAGDLTDYGQRQRESISEYNTGTVYKVTMDNSDPLAFGYDDNYFSLKLDSDAYAYLENGRNVGITKEDAAMSGFIGYKAKQKLVNTLDFGVQSMGRGSVVYMVDNPLFRAFWYNGKLLFGNAVFLVGND